MSKIWTPPALVVVHPTLFTSSEIDLYEKQILANKNATEHDASKFFAKFPKFLYLGSAAEIRREVVLTSDGKQETQRVDFFRRTFGDAFWDILEIKGPQKAFAVSADGHHPRVSSIVSQAISQAEDYRDMIISDAALRERLRRIGIALCRPQITVIVGQNQDNVPDEVLAVLYDRIRRGPINARTYTDIYNFAREHCARNSILFTGSFSIDPRQFVPFGHPGLKAILADRGDAVILSLGVRRITEDDTTSMAGESLFDFVERHENRRVVLDLAELEFIGSAMLGKLITAQRKATALNAKLAIAGLSRRNQPTRRHNRISRYRSKCATT
jgi:hypothetical protein